MELEGKLVAELRAEFEASTARLREDLQGQLWNYYGALRHPASALKERVEQLEEKLEELSKGADKPSYLSQADTNWRLAEVERQVATAERQRKDVEANSKECLQDLSALKHRLTNLEMTQSGFARQLKESEAAQADLQEKLQSRLKQQELLAKEGQNALKKDLTTKLGELEDMMVTAAGEAAKLAERLDEGKEIQKAFEICMEELAASLKKEATSWTSGIKSLQDRIEPMDAQLTVVGQELGQFGILLRREVDDRERASSDWTRKLIEEEAERISAVTAVEQRVSALTTETTDTLRTLKGDLDELASHVKDYQQEEKRSAEKVEKLTEKVREESSLAKERFETQQKKEAEQLEDLKEQLQQQFHAQLNQQMTQVISELSKCRKEEAAVADRLEQLNNRFREEMSSTKERFEAEHSKRIQQMDELKRQMSMQFNSQLQQMQRDLKSFLHEQDSTLQERVQKQMSELHETILQRMQALISSRIERCQADILQKTEKRADQTELELHSLKESQGGMDRRLTDLQKDVQKNAAELQQVKVESSLSIQKIQAEEGQLNSLKSTEDKLSADLRAMKEGIDSIKNSVNGHSSVTEDKLSADLKAVKESIDLIKNSVNGAGISPAGINPWQVVPGPTAIPGVMTPPAVPLWPRSQPCSPVSEVRPGPLLRPSNCNASAGSCRPASVSPPWVRSQVFSMKAPPPIAWVNASYPEPVANVAASGSHVPPLLPSQAVAVASQQSASSSESSEPPAPGVLTIHCPATPGLPAISGEYCLVSGICPNGRPLWKHRQQELWLYLGTNHRWFVGGPDAKEWKFKCEAGFIYSDPVKTGSTPDQASGWARFQGGLFVADPNVRVSLGVS